MTAPKRGELASAVSTSFRTGDLDAPVTDALADFCDVADALREEVRQHAPLDAVEEVPRDNFDRCRAALLAALKGE